MTEIYSIYSFGKVFCLLIESQLVMSSMPKRLSCINIDFLQVTSGKTLCMKREREQGINLSLFYIISFNFPDYSSTIKLDTVVMATWQYK
jgi:hypothetical protein